MEKDDCTGAQSVPHARLYFQGGGRSESHTPHGPAEERVVETCQSLADEGVAIAMRRPEAPRLHARRIENSGLGLIQLGLDAPGPMAVELHVVLRMVTDDVTGRCHLPGQARKRLTCSPIMKKAAGTSSAASVSRIDSVALGLGPSSKVR